MPDELTPVPDEARAGTGSGLAGAEIEPILTVPPVAGAPKPHPILVVDDLTRSFGGLRAVDVDHLEVERGVVTALIGPNGAGKTTLFNLLTGFDRADTGRWSFDGQPVSSPSPDQLARQGMIRTFQLTKSLAKLTVLDNVLLGAPGQVGERLSAAPFRSRWRDQEQANIELADELLERFNLAHMRDELAGTLSGGQRKLLEVARALMADPVMIMLDEPMAGEDITGRRPHELVSRGIGFVPQTDNVFPRLTIKENLEMGAFQKPSTFHQRFEVVAELFPLLAERRDQRADGLSGGQRQMVAIGRALMMDPQVVLLDEPSAGLSPAYQDQVFEQVTHIAQHGVSLIMVEQNARRCLEICDRGYVLDHGTNAYTGTGRELLDDPMVVSLYLGSLMGS